VEGLVWRDGVLVASRWWEHPPNTESWLNFQRGAGVLPAAQMAEPPDLPAYLEWAPTVWAEPQKLSDLLGRNRLYEQMTLALALLLLALPTLWLGKSWLILNGQVATLSKEKQRLEAAAQPLIQARAEALDAQMTLETIVKLVDHPNPEVLLAHLSRQLPKDGTLLHELTWEGERVRLVLLPPPSKSRIAYVEALEVGGWLHNVHEVAPDGGGGGGGDGMVLVADLVGNAPPAAGAGKAHSKLPSVSTPADSPPGGKEAGDAKAPKPSPNKGAGL
jgi:hypothetical protein